MDAYYAGICSTEYIPVESLRDMCDAYYDPRLCEVGGTRTYYFSAKGLHLTKDLSNLCLKFYNQKNNKNFVLKEVLKLNIEPREFYCMTFEACDAESNECRFFRGVVYSAMSGRDDVLLCEIKDDGGVTIPPEHDESYDPMSEAYNDSCPTDDDDDLLTIGSAIVDCGSDTGLGDGLAVVSEVVNRGSDAGLGDGLSTGLIDVKCGSDVGCIGAPSAPKLF